MNKITKKFLGIVLSLGLLTTISFATQAKMNNINFLNQLKEVQKTYREREEKLIKEKNEEIKKLRMRNKSLERESCIDNNK